MTVRDGRVLGDVSGAGVGAALGCCSVCCFGVLVTVRAHMDGRVLGRVLFGVLWLSHHHDAGRSIVMLTDSGVVAAQTVARNGSWLVYHPDVV